MKNGNIKDGEIKDGDKKDKKIKMADKGWVDEG